MEYYTDTPEPVRISGTEGCIAGWCFTPGRIPVTGVGAVIDQIKVQGFIGQPRPDVAQHFSDLRLTDCGFVVRFPLPSREGRVQLYADLSNGKTEYFAELPCSLRSSARKARSSAKVDSYSEWLEQHDTPKALSAAEYRQEVQQLPHKPLISIILPVFNSNPYFLWRCIQSVRDQIYPNWQLCIADDGSTDTRVREYVDQISSADGRIVVKYRTQRGNISANSNSALELASGEFVVLLDHDDELHPAALQQVVARINSDPGALLIYTDEDKMDYLGRRSSPAFKPEFDYDLLLSFNYLGHLVCLRRDIVQKIGGFRTECDGAQDWDLLIRAVEVIDANEIHHIALPLYHWRMHEESTAQNLDSKPYAQKAWGVVLRDHAVRKSLDVEVEHGVFLGSMRMRRKLPAGTEVAVVLPEGLPLHQVADAIHSACPGASAQFLFAGPQGLRCAASQESFETIADLDVAVTIFIDRALECVNHKFLEELAAQALRADCGVVGGVSVDPERTIVHSGLCENESGPLIDVFRGLSFSSHGYMGIAKTVHQVSVVRDSFFAVRTSMLAEVGGVGRICSMSQEDLGTALSRHARFAALSVLVTPYAIATLASPVPEKSLKAGTAIVRSSWVSETSLTWRRGVINANLGSFNDMRRILCTGQFD